MLALCKHLFIIAEIQINEKYCDTYLIEHSELKKHLVAYMQISHVLFMQISHVLHDDCGQKRNTGQRSSLLDENIIDVGKQTMEMD